VANYPNDFLGSPASSVSKKHYGSQTVKSEIVRMCLVNNKSLTGCYRRGSKQGDVIPMTT
jgi:hypothetical protein